MGEFLSLLSPQDAYERFFHHLPRNLQTESVQTIEALGRVLAEPVSAPHALPSFNRSTVDGYAVRAADTHGASESLPAYLRVRGEVMMGKAPDIEVPPGECVGIHTGGMLPDEMDSVVMIEHSQLVKPDEVEIFKAVSAGENLIRTGEDVQAGEEVLPKDRVIRAAEIGGLMALGIMSVKVYRQPRVAILSSGDEVVEPSSPLKPGQIRDINTYSLQALIQAAGGVPKTYGIIPDEVEAFRTTARQALDESDLVVFTAGSSISVRDYTARTIAELGEPGVLVHGISIRPGKPTILAVCAGKGVIGLPGNPVSALIIARLFVTPVIDYLQAVPRSAMLAGITAQLTINLSSQAGREDWIPVRLIEKDGNLLADPVFGKSNLIFSLVRADGLIRIPPNANGLPAGTSVHVQKL